MSVYVFMHASAKTHVHIYILAHVHPCMCVHKHVCMYAWIHVDVLKNMMGMHTFIVYLGNDLIMHGLLQRIHSHIFLIMTADTIMTILYVQNLTAMRYIDTNTHISFVPYSIRKLACIIILAYP